MINKDYVYAVVGASNNTEKYGYKVVADLKEAGFKVVPINPTETTILGLKVFHSLSVVDRKIDVVIFVVPPAVTEKVLMDLANLGIKKAWLQPGSESDKAIDFCLQHKIECIHNVCIMLSRHK